jgi:hypothetical protein
MMDQLVKAQDFTWAMSKVFVWSCCEPFVGIVCACLPTYAPLFRKWWGAGPSMSSAKVSAGASSGFSKGSKVGRSEWSQIDDTVLRGNDDEVELTTDISGGQSVHNSDGSYMGHARDRSVGVAPIPTSHVMPAGGNDPELAYEGGIMVRKDVSWSRAEWSGRS